MFLLINKQVSTSTTYLQKRVSSVLKTESKNGKINGKYFLDQT